MFIKASNLPKAMEEMKLFATVVLFILSFIGSASVIPLVRSFAIAQTVLLLLGLILATIITIGIAKQKTWAKGLLIILFSYLLLDSIFLLSIVGFDVILELVILAEFAGLMISLFDPADKKLSAHHLNKYYEELAKENLRSNAKEGSMIESVDQTNVGKSEKKDKKQGRYIGSVAGLVYHVPNCMWVKKIAAKRRVWFKSAEDAHKKGYDACNCTR